jgi:hypothetical protein
MLPYTEHSITLRPQLASRAIIAPSISVDLLLPEAGSCLGRISSADRASVPEAPIDEKDQFGFWEVEVRVAKQAFGMPAPARNGCFA